MFNKFNRIESGCIIDRQLQGDGCTGKEKEEAVNIGALARQVDTPGRCSRRPGERVGNLGALLAHVKYPASVLRMP